MSDVDQTTEERRKTLSVWDPEVLTRIDTDVVDLFGYKFKIIRNDRISRRIAENGIYEAAQTRLIPSMLSGGGHVFDVGANIGYFTLWLHRLALSRATVHAFEPNPLAFSLLSENVASNGLTDVRLNNVAVGKAKETMKIDLAMALPGGESGSGSYNLGGWSLARRKEGEHEVNVISIDDYVEDNKIDAVRFMKIDTEGFERQVLLGAADTLKQMRPNVMIHIMAPNERRRTQALSMIDFLQTRRYNIAVVEGKPFPHLRKLREADTAPATFSFYAMAIRRDLSFLGD